MDQQEQSEWDSVNKLLQHHGFKPVHLADPIQNKNLSDLVLLEKSSAGDIRTMLTTMLKDSERRQALIQELIQSNNQLKQDAQQHLGRAARQSQRAVELEGVLDGVKARLQDLEDSYISKAAQHHGQLQQLQQDQRDTQKRYQALEQKLSEEKEEVSQLKKKLYYMVKEEERRVTRQNQVFQQIHKRSARPHSPVDQQVLDVIDVYEAQIQQMQDELRSQQGDSEGLHSSDQSQSRKGTAGVSSNYKSLLKSYREQLKDTKAQREELTNEIQQLKRDLESRPTVKELKAYKHQLRLMDRVIKQNNVRCAQLCKEGDRSEIRSMERVENTEGTSATFYLKMLTEISRVVTGPGAPLQLHRDQPQERPAPDTPDTPAFHRLLPTLELWANQLGSLEELQQALVRLRERLVPWRPGGGEDRVSDSVRVEELVLLVETLLKETATSDEKVLRSPTRNTLQSMVAHFQKLFDAPSLCGVYPRMNEVYTRLGEMTNAMTNLRDILALSDRAPPSEVVNQVSRLASTPDHPAGLQLHNLLGTRDMESIISKVKEHEEFFPAFYSLVQELLQTLDVQHLDDIMPALRWMKLRTD